MNNLVLTDTGGYKPGDEEAIIRFSTDCGYHPTLEFWKWINHNCPDGLAQYVYAVSSGSIASHYSYMPRIILCAGSKIKAGLGIHLASHPDHRCLETLIKVLRGVTERAAASGVQALFGFPNNNSFKILNRMMRWHLFADIPALEADLLSLSTSLPQIPEYVLLKDFSPAHTDLIKAFVPDNCVSVAKSTEYLSWRYIANPTNKYHILSLKTGEAFAVLKIYQKEGTKFGHLVEIGCDKADHAASNFLFSAVAEYFLKEGVNRVSFWLPSCHPLYNHIAELGFEPCGFKTHFGCLALNPLAKHLETENWYVSMGDSDAF